MEPPHVALVAGGSGLVGGHVVDLLLQRSDLTRIISLGRRPLDRVDARLEQRTVDFGSLNELELPSAQVALCCLGTTIKRAGSREAFRAVDHDAVLAFAERARAAGVRHFLVVTALGADPSSRLFYNRVKGEAEASLRGVGFEALSILRPSLLLGERAESRPAERAAIIASKVFAPLLRLVSSRPIEGLTVARAMVNLAMRPSPGVSVFESGELHVLAR